jgi:hypothetical protein
MAKHPRAARYRAGASVKDAGTERRDPNFSVDKSRRAFPVSFSPRQSAGGIGVSCCAGFRPPGRWPIRALLRPAAGKRQGTKSRDGDGSGGACAMGILPRAQACG